MSQSTVIGKVAITPQGEFLLGTAYSRLSVVSYQGSSYIAIQDNQNVPVSDTSNWYLLASKGNGIASIVLQSTSGNTSTYRITYDDNTYFDFDIHNGPDQTSDLENDGEDGENPFITKEVNNLENYELKGNVGTTLEMSMNNSTYVITLALKNYAGTALVTKTIDLPLEGDIVNGSYSGGTLTLTKRNNQTIQLALSDLVPDTRTIAGLGLDEDITAAALIEAIGVYTQDEVDTLLEPIRQDIEFLESNYDTDTATGDNIRITDSLNGYIGNVKVGGNASQASYTGKNLLQGSPWSLATSGMGYPELVNFGVIINDSDNNNVSFTSSETYKGVMSNLIPVTSGTSYTLSFSSSAITNRLFIEQYNSSQERVSTLNQNLTPTTQTVTASQDGYIRVAFTNTTAGSFEINNIQLEEGSEATSYEPYVGGLPSPSPYYPQDIKVVTGDVTIKDFSNNLLDGDNPDVLNNATERLKDGIITISSNITNVNPNAIWIFDVKENDVFRMNAVILDINGKIAIQTYSNNTWGDYSDKTYINGTSISSIEKTIVSGVTKIRLLIYSNNTLTTGATTSSYKNVVVTINNSDMTYTPYKSMTQTLSLGSIELCKIQDDADYIWYDNTNNKWYKHKAIGKATISAPSAITVYQGQYWASIGKPLDSAMYNKFSAIRILCECAHYSTNNTERFSYRNTAATSWGIMLDSTDTIEDIAPKINGKTYYYQLLNPVEEEITDTTLIGQLNNLRKFQTYKNITIITVTPASGNPAILEVTYWVDEYMSLNDRVTALENRVALLE